MKRINILEHIYKRLASLQDGYRQNIALIGQVGVGKTTILKYLLSSFKRPQLTFAYVNLECSDFAHFAYKLLGSLLYRHLQDKGLIIKDNFDYLTKATEQFLPKTCESIKFVRELIEKRKINEAFGKIFDSIDVFTLESGQHLVLIIDEFTLLDELGIKNIFTILGKKIMLQKSVAFIIASSQEQKAQKILSEKLSLLFGNFEIVNVNPLDHKTSKEFISSIVYPFNIPDTYTNFLINSTDGFPLYLKLLSIELSRLIGKSAVKTVDSHLIAQMLYNLLSKETGLLNEKFSNAIERVFRIKGDYSKKSFSQVYKILYSIASGHNKTSQLEKILRKRRIEVYSGMSKLFDQGIISKNASFFKLNDPLFQLWIKSVFSQKFQRLNEDELEFKGQFIAEMEKDIENFIFQSKRNSLERIQEIFKSFDDDSIIFERRRLKLERFDELKPLSFQGPMIKEGLLGRSAQKLWITALKPDNVSENDISEFALFCKNYKSKKLTKLLIAFGEVDLNASLLAKEEKIQTWNLNHLNLLLDLFGKPKIIYY